MERTIVRIRENPASPDELRGVERQVDEAEDGRMDIKQDPRDECDDADNFQDPMANQKDFDILVDSPLMDNSCLDFDPTSTANTETNVVDVTPSSQGRLADSQEDSVRCHCYCQTTVVDHLNMVVCEGCGLYFHQDCFRNGRFSSLLGDMFIEFTCESCATKQDNDEADAEANPGGQRTEIADDCRDVEPKERIVRKQHTWSTAVALALFNLHRRHSDESRQGYFQWREQVCRYIEQRWSEFFCDRRKAQKWQGAVACTLSLNTGILFQSGASEIGEPGWWKLIVQVPPDPKNPIGHKGGSRRKRGLCEELTSSPLIELGPRIRRSRISNDSSQLSASVTNAAGKNAYSRPEIGVTLQKPSATEEHYPDVQVTENSENTQSNFDDIDITEDTSQLESICSSTDDQQPQTVEAKRESLLEPTEGIPIKECLISMPLKQEKYLLERLEELVAQGDELNQRELRFLNKLRVRRLKRIKGLSVFDIDKEVARLSAGARVGGVATTDRAHELLDQFVHTNVISTSGAASDSTVKGERVTFATRLLGSEAGFRGDPGFRSPYTQRILKPYIFRDYKPDYPRIRLMQEICSHQLSAACRLADGGDERGDYEVHPVDLVYIRPQHIAVINSICRSFFWAGIDLSDQLAYPEFSVVAQYGRLVIGFACMAPLANCNEAYLSFLWTHPHFRRHGLARSMLYHLSQSCMGRDIVLHVAATNPAVFLYQSFKFRLEKVCLNFYDKYLPAPLAVRSGRQKTSQAVESRHALYMRLKW